MSSGRGSWAVCCGAGLSLALVATPSLAAPPIEKRLHFSVVIEARFSPSYEILGMHGAGLTPGQVTLDSASRLRTQRSVPLTLWQVSPDGNSRSQVKAFRMKWTEVSAEYIGDSGSEAIAPSLVRVAVDYQQTAIGNSFELAGSVLGYHQVEVYSDEAIASSAKGFSRIIVRLAGVFENVIE